MTWRTQLPPSLSLGDHLLTSNNNELLRKWFMRGLQHLASSLTAVTLDLSPPYVNQAQRWDRSSEGLYFLSKASVQGSKRVHPWVVSERMDHSPNHHMPHLMLVWEKKMCHCAFVSYNHCSTVIKREIFCKKVRYGGLLVFADGVRMNPKDVVAVQALIQKTPQNKGDVRDVLLGFGI